MSYRNREQNIAYCREYYAKYKVEINRKRKEKYHANIQEARKRVNEYKARNKELVKIWNKRAKLKAGDKYKEKERLHKINNREYYRLAQRKRKALQKSSADGTVTVESVKELWTGQCAICERDIIWNDTKTHLDHIIPITKQGAHSINNLQWACSFCNISKGNKIPSIC